MVVLEKNGDDMGNWTVVVVIMKNSVCIREAVDGEWWCWWW